MTTSKPLKFNPYTMEVILDDNSKGKSVTTFNPYTMQVNKGPTSTGKWGDQIYTTLATGSKNPGDDPKTMQDYEPYSIGVLRQPGEGTNRFSVGVPAQPTTGNNRFSIGQPLQPQGGPNQYSIGQPMSNNTYKNGQDLINYYSNHYLSSDTGQAFIEKVFKGNDEVLKLMRQRIANHNKAIEQLNKNFSSPQPIQVPTNGQTQVPNSPSSQLGSMLSGQQPNNS